MRAILCHQFGPIDQLVLGELDDPTPGAGEVLLDVHAAGINFPDLLMVQGKYQLKPPLPFVPGGECSGVVAAIGEGVESVAVGDPVIAMGQVGAFAEKMVVKAESLAPLPPGLDPVVAAGIAITYGTSLHALRQRAQLQEGETLLVLGAAGGVGLAAVELGKTLGARVIAAASSAEKLRAAEAAGADLLIDYSQESLKDRIKELTDRRGVDVIYDPVGGNYSEQAFRGIAWQGRHLVVGFAAGEIPKMPLNLALLKGAQIVGVFWGSWCERDPAGSAANFADLGRMLSAGKLKPRVAALPLERFAEGFRSLAERRAIGKIVLTMGS